LSCGLSFRLQHRPNSQNQSGVGVRWGCTRGRLERSVMSSSDSSVRFVDDTRAVSAVIGFILIFGILVLLLTTYQAAIVPQQNAQTEFEHFEDNRNEMIQLRNAISTAGQSDVSQFPSVKLGTNYQTRLLTINPPPPSGTLQTSEAHNITISNGNEEDDLNITTRFLEYRPGYNELTIGPTRFEHSVLYLDERERGNGVSVIEDQNIVKDGKVRITALQNQFQQSGTGRVTLELYPKEEVNASAFPESENGNLSVKVPTQLSEEDYWDRALNDSTGIYQGVDSGRLNLSVNQSKLEVNTVGIQLEPEENAAKNLDPQRADRDNENGNGNVGGSSSSNVNYIDGSGSAAREGPDTRVDLDIENEGSSDVTITDIEVDSPAGNLVQLRQDDNGLGRNQHEVYIGSSTVGIYDSSGDDVLVNGRDVGEKPLVFGEPTALTQNGVLAGGETAQVTLMDFRNNDGQTQSAADSEITVTLYFNDGSSKSFTFTPPGFNI